jgi:ribonuclease E
VKLSRRVKDDNERSRLRALAILIKPAGMGLLVRTEADGKAEEAIMEDLESLQKQWESIQQQANSTRPPALLNRDDDFIQRVLRDMYSADVNRIVVDSSAGLKRVKQHLTNWGSGRTPQGVLIDHHRERQPILDYFRVNAAIREALKPRVELPSGGYIIIEPTEALTVIDVNSGSFTRSATARETVLWTNSEAATEIARQLRLRNIGGVVIVDFIDMDSRRDQLKLLEHFNKALKSDKARPQIAQLSELGLVELTRKRQGKNIYELFSQPCPSCSGLGHLVNLPGKIDPEALETVSVVPQKTILTPQEKRSFETEIAIEPVADFEYEETPQQLDLLHHPSYQEQTPANTNLRRRRRRRLGDLLTKEELAEQSVYGTLPKEMELEPEPVQEERKSRGQSARMRVRDEASLEQVAVEMTDLEQDVYALMGISPLIRVDREFKDPKSVLVSIARPGETVKTETTEAIQEELVEQQESAPTFPKPEELETLVEPESEFEPESDPGETDGRRRRRRRSSVQEVTV